MNATLPIKIQLPDGFLKEEVRCGYTVCEKLKKIWAVELDLLNEFAQVCKQHNIKYQVFAGTLLGAERHQGFIPWDDDLDVILDRRNFKKLCRFAGEFKHPYFLQTALTDRKFYCGYARLRNSLTTGVIAWEQSPEYNGGIYIDVYVMDGVAEGWILNTQVKLMQWFRDILYDFKRGVRRLRGKYFLPHIARRIVYKLGFDFAVAVHDWLMNSTYLITDKIGQLTHEPDIYNEHWITKKEFANTENVKFEFLDVPVPCDRRVVLSRIYGDYMKFPPIEELGKWHETQIHFDPDLPYKEYFATRKS